MTRLSNLRSFEVDMRWFHHETCGIDDGVGSNNEDMVLIDLPSLEYAKSAIFRPLTQSHFSRLMSLHLNLPCTYFFVELNKKTPDEVFARLTSLFLGVTDTTGTGQLQYPLTQFTQHEAAGEGEDESEDDDNALDGEDQDIDEDHDDDDPVPQSNLQRNFPNQIWAQGVFEIIARCPNLESLGLSGTHKLNGNLLRWSPASRGLKTLSIFRVNFGSSSLKKLLSPASSSASILLHVWLEDVNLTVGWWKKVFSHLEACPNLVYFRPFDLGYIKPTWSYIPYVSRWSKRFYQRHESLRDAKERDTAKLKELVDALIAKAGGEDEYPKFYDEKDVLVGPLFQPEKRTENRGISWEVASDSESTSSSSL